MTRVSYRFRRFKERDSRVVVEILKEQFRNEIGNDEFIARHSRLLAFLNRFSLGIPRRYLFRGQQLYVLENPLAKEVVAVLSLKSTEQGQSLHVDSVAVKPGMEGQGIGTELIEQLVNRFGSTDLTLDVRQDNTPAVKLYSKFGFITESESTTYVFNNPITTKPFPEGYSARLAQPSDLENLNLIIEKVPDMNDLKEAYQNSFGVVHRRFYRRRHQLPVVLLHNDQVVGLGRALWTRGSQQASAVATAVILEAAEAYPGFISFLSSKLAEQGVQRGAWTNFTRHQPFLKYLEPYLDPPRRSYYFMRRTSSPDAKEVYGI